MSFIFSAINRGHCSIYSRVLQIWKPLILEFRKICNPGDLSQFPVKHHILLCVVERSSHQRCSVMKGVLSNFANFTGKHLAQLAKFLRTPSLTEHLRWLLLNFWDKLHCFKSYLQRCWAELILLIAMFLPSWNLLE